MCDHRLRIVCSWDFGILLRDIKALRHLILFFWEDITFFLSFLLFAWSFISLLLRLRLLLLFLRWRLAGFFLLIEDRLSYLLALLCYLLLNISLFLFLALLHNGFWPFWLGCLGDWLNFFGFIDALGDTYFVLLDDLFGLVFLLGLNWDFWFLCLRRVGKRRLCWFFEDLLCWLLSYSRYFGEICKMVLWGQKRIWIEAWHLGEIHGRKER